MKIQYKHGSNNNKNHKSKNSLYEQLLVRNLNSKMSKIEPNSLEKIESVQDKTTKVVRGSVVIFTNISVLYRHV